MIVVKIELVSARTGDTTELGRMVICNDGTQMDPNVAGQPDRGNYDVYLGKRGEFDRVEGKLRGTMDNQEIDFSVSKAVHNKPLRTASVKDYPRLAYSVWVLIARALKALEIK